jgi:hypothetical protein
MGYGFGLVSFPNYLFESLAWVTVAALSGSWAGTFLVVSVMFQYLPYPSLLFAMIFLLVLLVSLHVTSLPFSLIYPALALLVVPAGSRPYTSAPVARVCPLLMCSKLP